MDRKRFLCRGKSWKLRGIVRKRYFLLIQEITLQSRAKEPQNFCRTFGNVMSNAEKGPELLNEKWGVVLA